MILLPHLYNCFLSLLAGHGSMVRFLQGCFFKQSNHSRFFSLYLHVRLSCFPNVSSYIRKGIARKVSNRSYRRQCQLLMILSSEKKRLILDEGDTEESRKIAIAALQASEQFIRGKGLLKRTTQLHQHQESRLLL